MAISCFLGISRSLVYSRRQKPAVDLSGPAPHNQANRLVAIGGFFYQAESCLAHFIQNLVIGVALIQLLQSLLLAGEAHVVAQDFVHAFIIAAQAEAGEHAGRDNQFGLSLIHI